MKNKKANEERAQRLLDTPTPYFFDLTDIPMEKYAAVLNILFHDPQFRAVVDKRNRVVRSVAGMRDHSAETTNAIRVIMKHDRTLADTIFNVLVQTNLKSDITYETKGVDAMIAANIDMTQDRAQERVDKLKLNLDKLTFLADKTEEVLVNVKAELLSLTNGKVEFRQMDAICDALAMLKGYFGQVIPKGDNPEAALFAEYALSIDEYMNKRMKTYNEKMKKIRSIS